MDASNQALEVQEGNRSSIRGGNIKTVYCLPQGDYWQIFQGNKSITSSDGRMQKRIGVDTTEAIRQAENEKGEIEQELHDKSRRLTDVKKEKEELKRKWNHFAKADRAAQLKINKLTEELDKIREEVDEAENVTVDTTEFEDDVKKAEEEYEKMKSAQAETEKTIDDMLPGIAAIQNQVEEVNARNERVAQELSEAEEKLQELMRSKAGKERSLQKKKDKLHAAKSGMEEQVKAVGEKQAFADDTLQKSRLMHLKAETAAKNTQERSRRAEGNADGHELQDEVEYSEEEIAAVEPILSIRQEPEYFQNKIRRIKKEIERERERRQLTETDPEVALDKYTRAKRALDTKVYQIDKVDINKNALKVDIRDRKKLWKQFRGES